MFHFRHIHTSLLTFTIIPFLLSIQNNIERTSAHSSLGSPNFERHCPEKQRCCAVAANASPCRGKPQKHGPFHWIPMAFSCCRAVHFSRLSCRELVLVILAVVCIETSCSRTSQTCPRQPKVLKHFRNEQKIRQTSLIRNRTMHWCVVHSERDKWKSLWLRTSANQVMIPTFWL